MRTGRILIWSALGAFIVPAVAGLSGSDPPSPDNLFPIQGPGPGVALLAVGIVAGLLALKIRADNVGGWTATLAGSAIGLGLTTLGGAFLFPKLLAMDRIDFIVHLGLLLAAGFATISIGYWLVRLAATLRSPAHRRPATRAAIGRALLPIGLAVVASFGLATLASYSPTIELTAGYPVLRIAISESSIALDPPTGVAGRANLVITATGHPICLTGNGTVQYLVVS